VETGVLRSQVVSPGQTIGDVVVLYCYPSPCKICDNTVIVPSPVTVTCEKVHEDSEVVAMLLRREGEPHRIHVFSRRVYEQVEAALRRFRENKTVGILLFGPPGTGKSSFVEVAQGILGVPTMEVSPSDVLKPYVGQSEKALESLFDRVETSAPCILFIDECEIFFEKLGARTRTYTDSGTERVMSSLRNIFLRRMQKLHNMDIPVLILAATNKPVELLDEAYRRAGRFDYMIHVPNPTWNMIFVYLELYREHISPDSIRELCKVHEVEFSQQGLMFLAKLFASFGLSMSDINDLIINRRHVMDFILSKKNIGIQRLVSLYPKSVGISRLSPTAETLITRIRRFYDERHMYPPRFYIMRFELQEDIAHQIGRLGLCEESLDHTYCVLPLIIHLFTEHGIPIVFTSQLEPHLLKEAALTAYESKGILIIDCSSHPDPATGPVGAYLKTFESPTLLINCEKPSTFTIATNITGKIKTIFNEILRHAKDAPDIMKELLEIYIHNLKIKMSDENEKLKICKLALGPGIEAGVLSAMYTVHLLIEREYRPERPRTEQTARGEGVGVTKIIFRGRQH